MPSRSNAGAKDNIEATPASRGACALHLDPDVEIEMREVEPDGDVGLAALPVPDPQRSVHAGHVPRCPVAVPTTEDDLSAVAIALFDALEGRDLDPSVRVVGPRRGDAGAVPEPRPVRIVGQGSRVRPGHGRELSRGCQRRLDGRSIAPSRPVRNRSDEDELQIPDVVGAEETRDPERGHRCVAQRSKDLDLVPHQPAGHVVPSDLGEGHRPSVPVHHAKDRLPIRAVAAEDDRHLHVGDLEVLGKRSFQRRPIRRMDRHTHAHSLAGEQRLGHVPPQTHRERPLREAIGTLERVPHLAEGVRGGAAITQREQDVGGRRTREHQEPGAHPVAGWRAVGPSRGGRRGRPPLGAHAPRPAG